MAKKKGKAKAKTKTPNAQVRAVETPPETVETYAPTITNAVKQDDAAALGVKDLPDISAKIPVGEGEETSVDTSEETSPETGEETSPETGEETSPETKEDKAPPEVGEKRSYAVTKGLPLHHPRQNVTCQPGIPATLKWDDWVRGQVNQGLLVEVDVLDFDPQSVQAKNKDKK